MDQPWECPIGDFVANTDEEKRAHIEQMADDPAHQQAMKDMGEDMFEDVKEKGQEVSDEVKDKAEDVADKVEDEADKIK